jgi:hypothetical protein
MIGGGHNAQSDKNATESDAFAEGMADTRRAGGVLGVPGIHHPQQARCAVGNGRPVDPVAGHQGASAPRPVG